MATKKTRAPRQSQVPADETKAQKFVRITEQRVPKAIKMLRNIAKLGGSGYERTQAQVDKITAALEAEVNGIKTALKPGAAKKEEKIEFKL